MLMQTVQCPLPTYPENPNTHPKISTGQGAQEAVAGLLQGLVCHESKQHQHVPHHSQEDYKTKD